MPAPAIYTEAELATYLLSKQGLGDMAGILGWSTLADLQEVVNETLLSYGVATINLATDIQKLRAIARIEAWRAVVANVSSRITFQAGSQMFTQSDLLPNALKALGLAEQSGAQYMPGLGAAIEHVEYSNDPYHYASSEAYHITE